MEVLTHRNAMRDWGIVIGASAIVAACAVAAVLVTTHVVAPVLFTHFDRFPALAQVPKRTANEKGLAGDPINVAVVASSDTELVAAFSRAGWTEAQPVTRATSIGIAKSVLLGRPDSAAPVSPLFLFGRRQDHALEREVGSSARRRHHVRLWRVASVNYNGRPVWIGSATFDTRAGLSRRGFHPTHHIDPDVDQERDTLFANLARAGQVVDAFHVTGMGLRVDDHNAEGDRFDTDGELTVLVLSRGNAIAAPPALRADPPLVALKNAFWQRMHR